MILSRPTMKRLGENTQKYAHQSTCTTQLARKDAKSKSTQKVKPQSKPTKSSIKEFRRTKTGHDTPGRITRAWSAASAACLKFATFEDKSRHGRHFNDPRDWIKIKKGMTDRRGASSSKREWTSSASRKRGGSEEGRGFSHPKPRRRHDQPYPMFTIAAVEADQPRTNPRDGPIQMLDVLVFYAALPLWGWFAAVQRLAGINVYEQAISGVYEWISLSCLILVEIIPETKFIKSNSYNNE